MVVPLAARGAEEGTLQSAGGEAREQQRRGFERTGLGPGAGPSPKGEPRTEAAESVPKVPLPEHSHIPGVSEDQDTGDRQSSPVMASPQVAAPSSAQAPDSSNHGQFNALDGDLSAVEGTCRALISLARKETGNPNGAPRREPDRDSNGALAMRGVAGVPKAAGGASLRSRSSTAATGAAPPRASARPHSSSSSSENSMGLGSSRPVRSRSSRALTSTSGVSSTTGSFGDPAAAGSSTLERSREAGFRSPGKAAARTCMLG